MLHFYLSLLVCLSGVSLPHFRNLFTLCQLHPTSHTYHTKLKDVRVGMSGRIGLWSQNKEKIFYAYCGQESISLTKHNLINRGVHVTTSCFGVNVVVTNDRM